MKNLFLFTIWLCALSATAQTFPIQTIVDHGNIDKRINILIFGDGYLNSEMDKFQLDAENVVDQLLIESPYKEYANFFNAIIIKVPSNETGTDHPATATDVSEPVFPKEIKDTYFNTTFDGANIHRLVITAGSASVYSVAATNFPSYDQILMIVNSTEYGGSGGAIATFSTHFSSAEIGIHEMGHSFAELADEYWAGDQYANEKPNMTADDDPNTVKWKNWLNTNNIGIYPYGASGSPSTWFRPHQSCKMRQLGVPFCSVCREQTIDRIYQFVTPIDAFHPADALLTYTGGTMDFSLDLIYPEPNTLKIVWDLDGTTIATNVNSISLNSLPPDESTLSVTVTDTTTLSQKSPIGYAFTESWEITNTTVALVEANSRLFYKVYPNPTSDILYVEFDGDFPTTETEIQLVDPSGKIVFSKKKVLSQKSRLEFGISNFPKGNYFLKIKRGNMRQSVPLTLK